jgi:hypothetical protein
VELGPEQRALNAARAVAAAHGIAGEQAVVVHSGSNVLVHMRPAPIVARVMIGTVVLHDDPRRWLEREVSVLAFLAPSGLAVAPSPSNRPGRSCTRLVAVQPRSASESSSFQPPSRSS